MKRIEMQDDRATIGEAEGVDSLGLGPTPVEEASAWQTIQHAADVVVKFARWTSTTTGAPLFGVSPAIGTGIVNGMNRKVGPPTIPASVVSVGSCMRPEVGNRRGSALGYARNDIVRRRPVPQRLPVNPSARVSGAPERCRPRCESMRRSVRSVATVQHIPSLARCFDGRVNEAELTRLLSCWPPLDSEMGGGAESAGRRSTTTCATRTYLPHPLTTLSPSLEVGRTIPGTSRSLTFDAISRSGVSCWGTPNRICSDPGGNHA